MGPWGSAWKYKTLVIGTKTKGLNGAMAPWAYRNAIGCLKQGQPACLYTSLQRTVSVDAVAKRATVASFHWRRYRQSIVVLCFTLPMWHFDLPK